MSSAQLFRCFLVMGSNPLAGNDVLGARVCECVSNVFQKKIRERAYDSQ